MSANGLIVRPGHGVRLRDVDPRHTYDFKDKRDAREKLQRDIEELTSLQDLFAAAQSHALLMVLQGMDSSGKDGAIKHVMSGVNPQGVDVHSFKQPSSEELRHDFLWRTTRALPERGRIGIFNRSYYEEVLVVRVHRELLEQEHVADDGETVWKHRYDDINALERHLVRNGTVVLKFFLHISKDEQRKRLLARLDDPAKTWKFSVGDVTEREHWDHYMTAYEDMLAATSTDWAPWYVIPSDRKWFTRVAVADILITTLQALKLRYPAIDAKQQAALAEIRTHLSS
jgi:PPK2 family polyphosphate:nucleotide phosphotransferase